MSPQAGRFYAQGMLSEAKRYVRRWARMKEDMLPFGYNWTFIGSVDVTMVVIGAIATVQRPVSDWPVAIIAMFVAFSPWLIFFVFNFCKYEGQALWVAWTGGTAILIFGTSTPIYGDFAPLLLSLAVGCVGAVTSIRGGALAALTAALLLGLAAALHRIDTPVMYLAFVGIGWLIGHLVRTQQELLNEQRAAHARLATLAAADERRRIAREVHDVIAHSLSITLLHLTGARHALQHDGDDEDAVAALLQAERLGRQAMADIRRTVGLLDGDGVARAPEPGVADIPQLVADFARAGLDVTLEFDGRLDALSPAAGLALYRIAQESLANVAKHAPDAPTVVTFAAADDVAVLTVVNALPPTAESEPPGRGMRGMRQRIEQLGGTIDIGRSATEWAVRASVPVSERGAFTTTGAQ